MTRQERDELLRELRDVEARLFPDEGAREPSKREALRLQDRASELMAEYADRLPRVVMGACPFTGQLLKRSFDPFGLDGPWWWKDRPFDVDEPAAPDTFKVLLGALALGGRKPAEAGDEVIPGPDVPFVVPRLLALPKMIAVVSRLELETGDIAYPISYWSPEELDPSELHQPWLRPDLWWTDDDGQSAWTIANDPWDFDLAPRVAAGTLRWIAPGDAAARVLDGRAGAACPYVGLAGDRLPQSIAGGERELLELPDGSPLTPFEE